MSEWANIGQAIQNQQQQRQAQGNAENTLAAQRPALAQPGVGSEGAFASMMPGANGAAGIGAGMMPGAAPLGEPGGFPSGTPGIIGRAIPGASPTVSGPPQEASQQYNTPSNPNFYCR